MITESCEFIDRVGHVEHGNAQFLTQAQQPGHDLRSSLRIQGSQRFVEQQHTGFGGQRAGKCHPLPLAARELGWIAIEQVVQAQQFDPLRLALLGRGGTGPFQSEGQVLAHTEVWEQTGFLKDIAQGTLVSGPMQATITVEPPLVADTQHTANAGLQTRQTTQERGFARTRGPKEHGHALPWQIQVQIQFKVRAAQTQAQLDACLGHGVTWVERRPSRDKPSKTMNEKATIKAARAWACSYSMASTCP